MVTYCSSLFLKLLFSFVKVCGGVCHLTLSDFLRYLIIFATIFNFCLMSRCFVLLSFFLIYILEVVDGASLVLFLVSLSTNFSSFLGLFKY